MEWFRRKAAQPVAESRRHLVDQALKAADQLPGLDPAPARLTRDVIDGEDGRECTPITDAEREARRERSPWEAYDR